MQISKMYTFLSDKLHLKNLLLKICPKIVNKLEKTNFVNFFKITLY